MKRLASLAFASVLGLAAGALVALRVDSSRHAAELAKLRAEWEAQRTELERSLAGAQANARRIPSAIPALPAGTQPSRTADTILKELQDLRLQNASMTPAKMRTAVYLLEELVSAGPAALPVIRDFLERYQDIEFDPAWALSKTARNGKLPGDFVLPPSLRLGLFDAVRRIGSSEAERLLSDMLNGTGRGLEVAYLTRLLQEIAPNKYRDSAVAMAKTLLGSAPLAAAGPLDRYHREYLFGVLSFYGDSSFATEAQALVIGPNNQVDRGALQYLREALGAQAVGIAAQLYQNPLLQSNAPAKEPLARLALQFAGADAQADEFYTQAINDPVLTKSHRSNLIEDLNEEGFPDPKNLTPNDLPLIQNRIALIEQLAPSAMDQVNAAAFKEAYKDLVNMRAKVLRQMPPGIR